MPFQLSPEAGHDMPDIVIKLFTSQWLERDQPAQPIRYGSYGYLVSQDLYDKLVTEVEKANARNARYRDHGD